MRKNGFIGAISGAAFNRAMKYDLRIVDYDVPIFECRICGTVWAVKLRVDGQLFPGYWKCPNGCKPTMPG